MAETSSEVTADVADKLRFQLLCKFREADADENLLIDWVEFKTLMGELDDDMTDAEMRELFGRMDVTNDGNIEYEEVFHEDSELWPLVLTAAFNVRIASGDASDGHPTDGKGEEKEPTREEIEFEMMKRHMFELLSANDADGNGLTDFEEFTTAMRQVLKGVSTEHIHRLFDAMDFDNNGLIDFNVIFGDDSAKAEGGARDERLKQLFDDITRSARHVADASDDREEEVHELADALKIRDLEIEDLKQELCSARQQHSEVESHLSDSLREVYAEMDAIKAEKIELEHLLNLERQQVADLRADTSALKRDSEMVRKAHAADCKKQRDKWDSERLHFENELDDWQKRSLEYEKKMVEFGQVAVERKRRITLEKVRQALTKKRSLVAQKQAKEKEAAEAQRKKDIESGSAVPMVASGSVAIYEDEHVDDATAANGTHDSDEEHPGMSAASRMLSVRNVTQTTGCLALSMATGVPLQTLDTIEAYDSDGTDMYSPFSTCETPTVGTMFTMARDSVSADELSESGSPKHGSVGSHGSEEPVVGDVLDVGVDASDIIEELSAQLEVLSAKKSALERELMSERQTVALLQAQVDASSIGADEMQRVKDKLHKEMEVLKANKLQLEVELKSEREAVTELQAQVVAGFGAAEIEELMGKLHAEAQVLRSDKERLCYDLKSERDAVQQLRAKARDVETDMDATSRKHLDERKKLEELRTVDSEKWDGERQQLQKDVADWQRRYLEVEAKLQQMAEDRTLQLELEKLRQENIELKAAKLQIEETKQSGKSVRFVDDDYFSDGSVEVMPLRTTSSAEMLQRSSQVMTVLIHGDSDSSESESDDEKSEMGISPMSVSKENGFKAAVIDMNATVVEYEDVKQSDAVDVGAAVRFESAIVPPIKRMSDATLRRRLNVVSAGICTVAVVYAAYKLFWSHSSSVAPGRRQRAAVAHSFERFLVGGVVTEKML